MAKVTALVSAKPKFILPGLQATFYLLLQARMAGVGGTFEARRGVLQRLLQRKAPSPSGAQVLRVRRSKLVSDAFEKSSGFTDAAWRQEWQVRFDGEQGVDWGGLQREFFTVLGRQLFDPTIPRGGGLLWVRMGSESGALVHPNGQALGERQLRYFNFAGRVMAKCLYDSVVKGSHHLLTVHFTRSLFKSVLGEPVSYNDFETDDPELFKAKVRFVLQNTINDAGLDLTFAEEHYDSKGKLLRTTPLVPGGDKIAVTDENKKRYLTLLARHRLGLVRQPHLSADRSPQLDAFAEGFYAVIPTGALENFDEHELELLVCGLPEIRASDLQTHVEYPRLANAQGMPLIQWFWQCVGNMSQAERARLLQFWTGSSQVPPAGFGAMEPKINIQLNHSPLSHLPVSHTCFNTLELPRYRSFQQLQQRLALAIQEGSEGFGEA